jgi:aspartate aminotransferase
MGLAETTAGSTTLLVIRTEEGDCVHAASPAAKIYKSFFIARLLVGHSRRGKGKLAYRMIMTQFDTTSLLSPRASAADEGAIIRMSQRTRELRAKGHDIVALTIGEPDFDTPVNIRDAAKDALDKGFTHYSPVAGIPELREAIAHKLASENGLNYKPTEIVLTNGTKQAINNAILSLIGAGDEVIILAPYWLSYEGSVRFAGGTPVVLSSDVSENYKVPAARIAAAITPLTKLLIVNSPCNPTGAVWSKPEMEAIAELVKAHPRMMVLADEIYEYIMFGGTMQSFGALPCMLERTITLNGFAKGFAMTGWRLGYAAAPLPIAQAMARMQSIISAGANMFVQKAAVAALKGPRDDVEAMRQQYQKRRDYVLSALRQMPGIRIADIPATFYAFPDVSQILKGRSSEALCDHLLENHGVAVVPGSSFGAPTSIRLSFAASDADLQKAMQRLGQGLAAF